MGKEREERREGGTKDGRREGRREGEEGTLYTAAIILTLQTDKQGATYINTGISKSKRHMCMYLSLLLPRLPDAFRRLLRGTKGSPQAQPTEPWDELKWLCKTKSNIFQPSLRVRANHKKN